MLSTGRVAMSKRGEYAVISRGGKLVRGRHLKDGGSSLPSTN